MENYSVQVPPYTVGPEAYRQIEKQCHIYGKKAVVVGGKKAMAAAKDKLLAAVKDTGIEILDFVWFGGECTFNNAKKLEQLEAVRQADMIFAVGGGKAIDTCKLVSIDFEKPYFSFPTIASNCAPTSAVLNTDCSCCCIIIDFSDTFTNLCTNFLSLLCCSSLSCSDCPDWLVSDNCCLTVFLCRR